MIYRGGERYTRSLFILFSLLFLWATRMVVAQTILPGELLISKLQITGGTGKTDNDYISIYNNSDHVLDLQGLRLVKRTASGITDTTIKSWVDPTFLNPGAYYTWANSNNGFAILMRADTFSSQTIANDNGVALRIGAENSGQILDSVGWGNATNLFVETNPYATNPGANQTLERINNQDSNNNGLDFRIVPTVFPGACGNAVLETDEECDDGNTINGDGCSALCRLETTSSICGNGIIENGETCDDGNTTNNDGCSATCQLEVISNADIYINEFVADPVTGANEWIELYTSSTTQITITNWSIEDGAGTKTKITGSIGGSNKFLVIEKPSGALNNSGDAIILRNPQGDIINQVTYGDWDDGNLHDNAPSAPDPQSVARRQDGVSTHNDGFDFAVTTTITKGLSNIITEPITEEEVENTTVSKEIIISEIYPNPPGLDSSAQNGEFIELYNQSETSVSLAGWRIEVGTKEYIYEMPANTTLSGKNYVLIPNTNYKLPNSGSSVRLFQPGKTTALQTVTYKEAPEGEGWMLMNETSKGANKIWQWTKKPTPGALNMFVSAPNAQFDVLGNLSVNTRLLFDSSDSKTNGEVTTFNWNFGDSATSTDPYPQHTYTKTGTYTVTLSINTQNGSATIAKKIKIVAAANLSELTMAITAGENTVAQLSAEEKASIRLNEILPNPSGKDEGLEWIELINQGDSAISLQDWRITTNSKKGNIIKEIIIEPHTLLLLPQDYTPTLGNTNETVQLLASDGSVVDSVSYSKAPENQSYALVNGSWDWTAKLTPGQANVILDSSGALKASAEEEMDGNYITGVVVSLPNIFSAQYFHLKPTDSEGLIQIYNSKKLFPVLALYQKVAVKGEMGSVAAGPRFKTKEAADITILGEETPSELSTTSSIKLKEPPYPRLVKVEGEVTSKKSPRLIVTDNNGDSEIYLAKGSNLSITRFNIGDKLVVTGILELSGTTPRVMPRSETDVVISNAPGPEVSSTDAEMVNNKLMQSNRDQKKQLFTYLIIGAILLIGGGGYGLWRWYGKEKV